MTDSDSPTCIKCGEQHVNARGRPTCTKHLRSDPSVPCRAPAVYGTGTCRYHGGATPRAAAADQRRKEDEAGRAKLTTLGLPIDIGPTDALLEEVKWTAGHVHWLRQKVQEADAQLGATLAESTLVWGKTSVVDKMSGPNPGTDVTHAAQPSVWYRLYAAERGHLVQVCTAALKAGVEERKVRLAEQQGDLVASVIRHILEDLNLTADQQAAVATIVPRHLRALGG